MMMVDDLGGMGVQKRPFCDDVICEQPLNVSVLIYVKFHINIREISHKFCVNPCVM